MGKIMYKGQEFQGKIERVSEGLDVDFYVPFPILVTDPSTPSCKIGTIESYEMEVYDE